MASSSSTKPETEFDWGRLDKRRYNKFGYCGKLSNDRVMFRPGRQAVYSMAWCPHPKKYAESCTDVIAVTGDFGIALQYRNAEARKDFDKGWSQLRREAEIIGHSLAWNPSKELEAGDLAINTIPITEPGEEESSKLIVLRFPRGNLAPSTQKIIYDAASDGSMDIKTFCWTFDGQSILVFTNDSNYIRYLTWSQESRSWTKNNIAYNNDGLSFNLVGCVPPSMQRQIFAVGGPNRPIKIFKKTEKYHKLSNPMKHWKELCSWSEPINIMAMSLSANGRSLAVLSEEGVVRVFSIWFPVLRTGTARLTFEPLIDEVPRITLGTTVEQEVEFKFMAWSRDNFLLISGDTLATVTILEFVEYKNEMHVVHDDTDGLGNGVDCIPPYNLVTQLCVCPHRQEMLSVLGHKGLILFWENVHYFARCKRDILKEKFPDDVPEMVDKLDLLQKEFDQQWANLNSKLVDATSQFKSMEERYMAIRERVEYYMRRVYEGKTDDLEKVLLDIYLKGKFRSML